MPSTSVAEAAARAAHRDTAARAIAIIPARGGSVGLPGKNVARVGGQPLIARAVRATIAAERVGRVVVSTDDEGIADAARAAGAEVVMRPAELSGSTASSESALVHALGVLRATTPVVEEHREATRLETPVHEGGLETRPASPGAPRPPGGSTVVVFVQATSPFVDPADIDAAVERVESGERDSVFSAVPTHRFLWRDNGDSAVGANHEASARLRRQDREPEFEETGAFYVFRADGFLRAGHRFFGRIGVQPVHPDHAIEIDDADDLARARALAAHVDAGIVRGAAGRPGFSIDPRHPLVDVDALVTDFDGVHTDDTATVDEHGHESVRVSRADGAGIARLRDAGVPILILSAERNPVVARRAEKLGVDCVQGVAAKGEVLAEWAAARGIRLDRVAYVGNDRGDLPALALAGWPIAVPDAAPDALEAARHVLTRAGGAGAVREVCDLIIAARDAVSGGRGAPGEAGRVSRPSAPTDQGLETRRASRGAPRPAEEGLETRRASRGARRPAISPEPQH